MAGSTFQAEPQWLAQMTAMRNAIAELKLPPLNDPSQMYGADLNFDDDLSDEVEDDIWDVESEPDDSPATDDFDANGSQTPATVKDGVFDKAWLHSKCSAFARSRQGIDTSDLEQQITAVLASDSSEDELQMSLADIIGFDDLDFVIELISHRREILSGPSATTLQTDGLFGQLQTVQEREAALRQQDYEHKHAALAPAYDRSTPKYAHVYKSDSAAAGNILDASGKRYGLPLGSTRNDYAKYEEYSVPAAKVGTLGVGRKLVNIEDMDGLCQRTFKGYKSLNRMQSLLYPVAYTTSENMLVCAPTGAGKTDAAMLTILQTVSKNIIPNPIEEPDATDFVLLADDFKIVYVAPMKALAAEVTQKLGSRLAWLGVQVRELTGDMQLTKREIAATQIIVTTPEKWDVVTRKSTGDTELVQKVRLLIIDEVHMLHDDRGAVIESLVARTERQVESTQSLIRIVGLSATLPNYVDVADFLKVNRNNGLFYFDASFRPVPLEQHFIGVKGKVGSKVQRDNLDQVTFEKIKELLKEDKQVMVFVHSRKDTVLTARMLYTMAVDDGCVDLLVDPEHPAYVRAMADLKTTRGRELRDIVPKGFGCHNAGMPRTDRNFVERIFSEGAIKVLCCTATLAWGVNLPAAAVIIKGTQLYSAEAGKFVDLGILDVLQIFGRAGRPQFQDTGIGFICTTQDKLQFYLSAVTQQKPIESRFSHKLVDNLNAEISLGTVTTIAEAVTWLGYSYLFVRMRKNPEAYGIDWNEFQDDPQLGQRRRKLIVDAARTLHRSQMIIFNERTDELRPKDVGRIASQYYVLQNSIEIFNTMMRPHASEADVLKMIAMSSEFDNIQSRDNEAEELQRLKQEAVACQVEEPPKTMPQGTGNDKEKEKEKKVIENHAKTNILLQSHISRAKLEDFALVSDLAYVAQNAARICRALFMIALNRGWGYQCQVLLSMCKAIEKQMWPFQHPFHQFDLPLPVLKNLDDKAPSSNIESLREMEPAEIGNLVHNQKMGTTISRLLDNFPTMSVEAEIAPLNRDVLRMRLYLYPEFNWNDRHHGTSESYWVWVENSDTSEIYHHEYFILSRRKMHDSHELNFTIPLADPLPSQIYVRVISDRWLGAETVHPVSFQHLIRPDTESVYTDLLDLQPLPISALKNPALEELYGQRFPFFNPMQTQIFHTLYHTSNNVLLGSPTGSGKTVAAELAMWWAFREHPGSKVVYIAPMKALVRERVQDWRKRLVGPMGLKLVELTGDNTPDTRTIRDADIIITTPEKWDGISRSWQTRSYVRQVSLVIIDEIHLLGSDRGPILEIIVSRMNYIASQAESGSIRLVGMSTACANATDLGNWLGVKPGNNQGLFNFRHSVRPVPLEIYIDGFPEQRGFCPLMQSMNRPTYLAIKNHSPEKPVIVFVASRRQTRLTAKDLINFCGMEEDPRRFLHFDSEDDLLHTLSAVKDEALKEALSFGIGLHHAGLVESDRTLSEQLFAANKIQILVATSTLAWGINLPAHLVVVKGTQFFDAKIEGYKDMDLTDVLQMLGRAGRPQFDTSGIARIFTQDAKKAFYKHFLHTGFPVESSLHKVLDNHLGAEVSAGVITTKQDALDYLTWTFFFRRLHKNPTYYGLEISAEEHRESQLTARQLAADYMVTLVDKSLDDLAESDCVAVHNNGDVDSTPFGKIMSYYYLSHLTIRKFLSKARKTTNTTFADALAWISQATEFDELPVRHNEDLINAELVKNLPLDTEGLFDSLPLWDPHVKAFLLIQAFMSRIELPISDYVGDQISVLDQGIRIIQAGIDVMTELNRLDAVVQMVRLLQCIKSARWPEDYPLSILPGVHEVFDPKLEGKVPADLVTTAVLASRHGHKTVDGLMNVLGIRAQGVRAQFAKAVGALPDISVSANGDAGGVLQVQLKRGNRLNDPEARIYAPKFPKPQTEGYFVVVMPAGSKSRGNVGVDILALKRAGWAMAGRQGQKSRAMENSHVKIKMPILEGMSGGEVKVDILVLSDAYPGMEWWLEGVVVPVPVAKVEEVQTVQVDIDESLQKKKSAKA
ncbi:putative steryl acetyl hydrolase mug81 [Elasticomyces elasticus]|uniref:Steryl acetyl hydrolase mug81 n=1 Tax=Exophiala sideris TaxID=1016849 RepID=A0ABR0J657_9EURO|nr:putative steryl acetyl hydrolase mug81 [Elasticomyces elasticus]KAK5028774.1 putative steryl acetyl hydrolase mug81 [Exophiala sideris]KAK5035643.1 putative steryl acetyl hydrolase mug81 [Exophiala sideris]KAK5057278.1 putative steryl acetyl hydrolase mug81 [Exophiala sideris]KAK5181749.1 putative steryl acetyl hydrolase mug81 [Eurotiomycetes sp. CCFEE 6388]